MSRSLATARLGDHPLWTTSSKCGLQPRRAGPPGAVCGVAGLRALRAGGTDWRTGAAAGCATACVHPRQVRDGSGSESPLVLPGASGGVSRLAGIRQVLRLGPWPRFAPAGWGCGRGLALDLQPRTLEVLGCPPLLTARLITGDRRDPGHRTFRRPPSTGLKRGFWQRPRCGWVRPRPQLCWADLRAPKSSHTSTTGECGRWRPLRPGPQWIRPWRAGRTGRLPAPTDRLRRCHSAYKLGSDAAGDPGAGAIPTGRLCLIVRWAKGIPPTDVAALAALGNVHVLLGNQRPYNALAAT